ncbi:MAG: hypothetical protein NPIRA03_06320 [Nitrospirales bacterium]|nr:MAG: hypothetical protein NPIRA03_06320 [Nitrospirales bacterium]
MRNTFMNIPIPTALVGLGLYWLFKDSTESSHGALRPCGHESPRWRKQEDDNNHQEEPVKEKLQHAKDTVEGHLAEWKGQARQQAYEWKKGTEQTMENVKGYINEKGTIARGEFRQLLDDHPLAVGAGMVAFGIAVAAAIPVSRKEDQWMGPFREKMVKSVKTKVGTTAEDVTQKAGKIAEKVLKNTEHSGS